MSWKCIPNWSIVLDEDILCKDWIVKGNEKMSGFDELHVPKVQMIVVCCNTDNIADRVSHHM